MLLKWRKPKTGDIRSRGISLFDEVPKNRTCKHAGIDDHWCTCLNWQTLSKTDKFGIQVAEAIVARINKETERSRKLCAPLKLTEMDVIRRLVPNENLLKYKV